MSHSIKRGVTAEMLVASKLSELGLDISFPISHLTQYDIIYDNGNKLYKIQVKRAFNLKNKNYTYRSIDCGRKKSEGNITGKYSEYGFDFMIICDIDSNDFWIIPRVIIGNKKQVYATSKSYNQYKNNFVVLLS